MMRRAHQEESSVDTIGYRRVSKREQALAWKASLQQQTEAITALAVRLGRVLLPTSIWEDRFSGEDAESRPGFMELVAYCRAHPHPASKRGIVLFLNDSRFGRFVEPDEAAYWRFELLQCGWTCRFAENDDTQNPTARHVLRAVGGSQASEYRANLIANAKRGARGAAEAGLWQNEAPFGYRRQATAPGRAPVILELGQRKSDDQVVRLAPGPQEEVATIRWAFQVYADGLLSLGKLATELLRRAPRLRWTKQHLDKMLANEAYLGHVIWCRRPHNKQERRETPVRPRHEWVVCRNAHEPLITQELFDRVQERLASNRRRTRSTAGGYPLSGLIRCTYCGKHYIGGGGAQGPDDDPDRFRFYRCAGSAENRRVCPGSTGTILKRIVEPVVIQLIADVVAAPQIQQTIHEEIETYVRSLHGNSAEEKRVQVAHIDALAREKANVVAAIARGTLTEEEAASEMDRIRRDLQHAERMLKRLEALVVLEADLAEESARWAALASDFRTRSEELMGPALRELLVPWVQEVTFDKVTRVLEITIRRMPRMDVLAGKQPESPGVRARVTFPRPQQDRRGQFRSFNHQVVFLDGEGTGEAAVRVAERPVRRTA